MKEKEQWNRVKRVIGAAMGECLGYQGRVIDYLIEHAAESELIGMTDLVCEQLQQHEKSQLQEELIQLKENWKEENFLPSSCKDFLSGALRREEHLLTWSIASFLRKSYEKDRCFPLQAPDSVIKFCENFGLSEMEGRIVAFFCVKENSDQLERALDEAGPGSKTEILCSLVGTDSHTVSRILGPLGQLSKTGITCPDHSADSLTSYSLNSIVHMVLQTGNMDLLREHLFLPARGSSYRLDQFAVPQENSRHMLSLLKEGGQLLITGRPGTGKTEFAYALAAEAGFTLSAVTTEDRETGNYYPGRRSAPHRKETIALASRLADSKSWLLIDEADNILSTGGGLFLLFGPGAGGNSDKGEINTMIEQFPVPGIWIVNTADAIPLSTLRRFTYVYAFPEPDLKARKRMLLERLDVPENNLPASFIHELAFEYRFTPSAIDRIARAIASGEPGSQKPEDRMQRGMSYIRTMSRGPAGIDFEKTAPPGGTSFYDESLCNASVPVLTIASLIGRRMENGRPLRLLFSGPPGGGKTSFALHLGILLEREIILRKPSDLLSKYVGEAEKLVARMFQEAEEKKAILVIDEADAFFLHRDNLNRSWEMSQASEWLQGIQNFSGILIACTNRADAMDPALRRRFHRDVRFSPLTGEMIDLALERFFPGIPVSEEDRRRLRRRDVMISDVASAAGYLQDTGHEAENGQDIIETIIAESELRNPEKGKIGFR